LHHGGGIGTLVRTVGVFEFGRAVVGFEFGDVIVVDFFNLRERQNE